MLKGQRMKLSEKVVFWLTPDFIKAFGKMDAITYSCLRDQVIAGKGDVIPMANGMRLIEIAIKTPGQAHPAWLVVFAVYQAYDLVVFLKKYPVNSDGYILIPMIDSKTHQPLHFRKKLTTKQQVLLGKAKKSLDRAVKRRFG